MFRGKNPTTGLPNKACTWFGELCSCPCLVSRNKLHQTTYKPYSGALYCDLRGRRGWATSLSKVETATTTSKLQIKRKTTRPRWANVGKTSRPVGRSGSPSSSPVPSSSLSASSSAQLSENQNRDPYFADYPSDKCNKAAMLGFDLVSHRPTVWVIGTLVTDGEEMTVD